MNRRPPGTPAGRAGSARTRWMLVAASCLTAASVLLPLWGMTLVSTQYPDGLRMVVYATHIRGDLAELNLLNHYIGMRAITDELFVELKLLPVLFGLSAAACLGAALARGVWVRMVPLALMAGTAVYGLASMHRRLYQFGHDLAPSAPIRIAPFTPPALGTHQIAQFATYSYFSWGTFLPLVAGLLVVSTIWLDLRAPRIGATR